MGSGTVWIGGSLLLVLLAGTLASGLLAWPLGSFLATVGYLCAFALEIRIAEWIQSRRRAGGV